MWKKFSEEKPPEDGPYLTYVSEINDLGKSKFIYIANWNMQMPDPEFQDYSGDTTLRKGARVTHWMPLPARPIEEVIPQCPICKSSMHKMDWFGYTDHCISPNCDNYFGAYAI